MFNFCPFTTHPIISTKLRSRIHAHTPRPQRTWGKCKGKVAMPSLEKPCHDVVGLDKTVEELDRRCAGVPHIQPKPALCHWHSIGGVHDCVLSWKPLTKIWSSSSWKIARQQFPSPLTVLSHIRCSLFPIQVPTLQICKY